MWGAPFNFFADKKTGLKFYFMKNENRELNFVLNNLSLDSWFIDVGANVGLYTMAVLAKNEKFKKYNVLSIEPNKKIYSRLKNNYAILKKSSPYLKRRVVFLNAALSSTNGYGYLDTSKNNANSLLVKKKSRNTVRTNLYSFIFLLKKNRIINPSFVKIDTEGHEFFILKNFLEKKNKKYFPNFFIIEHQTSTKLEKAINLLLKKNNYTKLFKTRSNVIFGLKDFK